MKEEEEQTSLAEFTDKAEQLASGRLSSAVQHGPLSDRVYLMKLKPQDPLDDVLRELASLATRNGYSKIIAKIPKTQADVFLSLDKPFVVEAEVPGFFSKNGTEQESALFLARYLTPERREVRPEVQEMERAALQAAKNVDQAGASSTVRCKLPEGYTWRPCVADDAEEMSALFRHTFESYPFPIHFAEFVRESIISGSTIYYAVIETKNSKIVALAGLEIDAENKNVEMSDFATHDEHQGKGLASFLLAFMDDEAKSRGLHTAYTIARALSAGMNRTFAKRGYTYAGTLVNNTHISGHIQSMNVWWKDLRS